VAPVVTPPSRVAGHYAGTRGLSCILAGFWVALVFLRVKKKELGKRIEREKKK